MGNYLSAECYKAVHRKYIYIFSAAMLGLVAAFMLLLRKATTISLNTPFILLRTQSPESVMAYAWALGMAWLTVSTIIGAISFQKKEIS